MLPQQGAPQIFARLSNPEHFTGVYKERHKDLRNRQLSRLRGQTAEMGNTNTVDNARRIEFHETLRPNLRLAPPQRTASSGSQSLITNHSRRTYRGPVPGGPTPLLGLHDEDAFNQYDTDDLTQLLSVDDSAVMSAEAHALDPEQKLQRVFLYYSNFGRSGVMRTERMGDWMLQKFVRECPGLLNARKATATAGHVTPKEIDLCFIKAIRGPPLERLLRAWKCYDESMTPEIVRERAVKVLSGCTGKSMEKLYAMAERPPADPKTFAKTGATKRSPLEILAVRNTDQKSEALRTAHRLTFKTFLDTLAAISLIRYPGCDAAEAFAVLLRRNVFLNPVLTPQGPQHLRDAAQRGANVPAVWSTDIVGTSAASGGGGGTSGAGEGQQQRVLEDGKAVLRSRQRAIAAAEKNLLLVRGRLERDVLGSVETKKLYDAVVQDAPAFLTDVRKFFYLIHWII